MPYYEWILTLLALAAAVWCGYHLYLKKRQLDLLQRSIHNFKGQMRRLVEDFQRQEDQRQDTEDRLRTYLKLMDALINTIPNPIYFKDAQGVYQGCNKVFAKSILGLTRDRIIGQRLQQLPDQIPPELAATYQRQESIMFEKRGIHTFEEEMQCADGTRRAFLFSMAPVLDDSGKLSGSVAVMSDLTEKNRAALDRMQKERLEGVLETAGAVCHEFNQPLQILSGYSELLSTSADANQEILSFLEKMFAQIDRMREITSKLQSITHYETMAYTHDTKIIDIHKSSR